MSRSVLHVQLQQGRQAARAFNLEAEAVIEQFLVPLRGDGIFDYADKQWDPRVSRVVILEGRKLRPDELMLGRGWQAAQRIGTEITEAFIAQAASGVGGAAAANTVERLKDRIIGRLTGGPLQLREVVVMASDLLAGHRLSERIAAAEQAVWELLHRDEAELRAGGEVVARERWEDLVLAAATWFEPGAELAAVSRS